MAEGRRSLIEKVRNLRMLSEEEFVELVSDLIHIVAIFVMVSILVFVAIALFSGADQVADVIIAANVPLYLVALSFAFLSVLVRYGKWRYYLKKMDIKIPFSKDFPIYLSLYGMNISPGRVGRILSAYSLSRVTRIKLAKLLPIITIDVLTDYLGFILLGIIAALYLGKYVVYTLFFGFLLLLPFAFLIDPWFYKWLKKHSERFRRSAIEAYAEMYFESQNILNTPSVYFVSLLITLPAMYFFGFCLYFSLASVGVITRTSLTILVYSVTQILGIVSLIPGSLGVTDGSLVIALNHTLGLDIALSSAATIMTRMATLWFPVLIGMIALIYTVRKFWKK